MSFGSPSFLFVFLPVFFLLYYILPQRWRNGFLLLGSLTFYSIDGGYVSAVLVASVIVNHVLGGAIRRAEGTSRMILLWSGILLNLAPLLYYKYFNFLMATGRDALMPAGIRIELAPYNIVLPAGISFFTFQGISYLVDIFRRDIVPAKSIVDFGMYHTLFPQLIAGPIVRYAEVETSVCVRAVTIAGVEAGIIRFCYGLAKKIIVADPMGSVADHMFGLSADQLTTTAAWIGALCYTLQIYFDFSGYSDMAIGLGRMLGFVFPENFNLPYQSRSITEFWRRWHMTLSRWFRDYVYIPLGGNRAGPLRTYVNLVAVFVLCGLWHGAAYTFLVWGCYHGLLLVIERVLGSQTAVGPLASVIRWPLTMLLVIVGWVIFRSGSFAEATSFLHAMAGFGSSGSEFRLLAVLSPDKIVFFVIGSILSLVPIETWMLSDFHGGSTTGWGRPVQQGVALLLFVYCAVLIAANGFNPFIYFRF